MFERSLLEAPPTHRWTTIVSITLQCGIAAAILAVPLLHPATLTFRNDAPKLFLPLKPAPVPPPTVATATSAAPPSAPPSAAPAGRPLVFTHLPSQPGEDTPPSLNPIGQMGTGDPASIGFGIGAGTNTTGPNIAVVRARPAARVRISSGISTGLLLAPIRPIYPQMAIATRTEGTVIVEAIISKSGAIEAAHATSGPQLLRGSAIDAVRNARYSPYLLNGTPTEVQTTITVSFRLAS
jgi:protein TonB